MRALALYWMVLSAAFLTGCAGYKLGPTNGMAAGARSVQVVPFQNHTAEPRLIDALSTALRRGLLQDGTYRLDTQGDSDVILPQLATFGEVATAHFRDNP